MVIALPFGLAFAPLSGWLFDIRLWQSNDAAVSELFAHALALCILALPWGLAELLHMPHATAFFAASGRPRDLFDPVATVSAVRQDFTTWNLVAAAIVTAWAVGLACVGLLCVGLAPGVFYAILVSANASAALHHPGADPSPG